MMKRLFSMVAMISILLIALTVSAFADGKAEVEYPKFEGELSISEQGIEMIKSLEGCINRPMSDYGQYSIGYGCSTEFAEKYGFSTTYLSKEEAHELLLFVLEGMEKKLDSFLKKYGVVVNQHQYDALMSFTFNLGSNWMSDSTRLGEILVNGEYTVNEFASALGVYCHVTTKNGPEVLDLLVSRRIREIKLFLYGAYNLTDVPQSFCTLTYEVNDEEGSAFTDIGFYQVGEPYQILFEASASEDFFLSFNGWYTEDGEMVTSETIAQGSTTVYASWSDFPEDAMLYQEGDIYISDLSVLPEKRSFGDSEQDAEHDDVQVSDPEEEDTSDDPWPEEDPFGVQAADVFPDVFEDQWYYDYVNDLYRQGIINGCDDGTFQPLRAVTTGEALKMIILAAGYEEPEKVDSHWARCYLDLALAEGILDPGDITDLDVPITRVMMAKVSARALGVERIYDSEPFSDTSNQYATALYDHGIMIGDETGAFKPERSLTRAELSTVVWRIYNYN